MVQGLHARAGAFAGSGGFKTVSVCVGALLSYRGPTVVLDPSTELAPMLLKARISMGHRVIAIDPAKPADTGFNILDWLDPASATADADVRSVVDWIDSAASICLAPRFAQSRSYQPRPSGPVRCVQECTFT